mmetsp:Transcript_22664/g.38533  ORF Transcript_22664/g.38533 Transcript_22664/m.38533 type:complete len:209 (-) Transcript_22664:190-816(-)
MILGMNPQQQESQGGLGTTHHSMPNLTAWTGVGSPPHLGNPFLSQSPFPQQHSHSSVIQPPPSHKRLRDGSIPAVVEQEPPTPRHPLYQQQQQQHDSTLHHQPLQQQQQQLQQETTVVMVPIDCPISLDDASRGKKCRSNAYRAPTRVQETVTSALGTLVGGSAEQTQATVQMRRQLSGSQLDQFLGMDRMDEDKVLPSTDRIRSMSF